VLSRNRDSLKLFIRHKEHMAADGFGGSNDGGNARVVVDALGTGDMGLQHSEFLGQGPLRKLPPTAHDRKLRRERQLCEELRMFQRRLWVRLKQFMKMLVETSH